MTRQGRAVGIPLGSEESGISEDAQAVLRVYMPDTNARLEPPRMATNKSGGGPWGWDVTPQGKRGGVNAARERYHLYEDRAHRIYE